MMSVATIPLIAAPISMGKLAVEPEIKYAIKIPGKTACEIASPSITIFRITKKLPINAQLMATKLAVNMI
jgi:hypothetical protein